MKKFIMLSCGILLVGSMGFGAPTGSKTSYVTGNATVSVRVLASNWAATSIMFTVSPVTAPPGYKASSFMDWKKQYKVSFTAQGVGQAKRFTSSVAVSPGANNTLLFPLSTFKLAGGVALSDNPVLSDITIVPTVVAGTANYTIVFKPKAPVTLNLAI